MKNIFTLRFETSFSTLELTVFISYGCPIGILNLDSSSNHR
ncbi:hypothetical protein [Sinomicrobium pectinilyticum]|nr:hypothetical protein [Sinomicrobium pectinilyticum]